MADLLTQINQWKDNLTLISRNLMDLAEYESTKIVRVKLKESNNSYCGITRKKATEAFRILDNLWEGYASLAQVVNEASTLAQKNNIFSSNTDQIRKLLEGESVRLPNEHVEVADRGLLVNANQESRITLSQMTESMQKSFEEARDMLSTIAETADRIKPRVTALWNEATSLADTAKTLGTNYDATSGISKALEKVDSDPIGCEGELAGLEVELAKQKLLIKEVKAEYAEVTASLDKTRVTVNQLKDLIKISAKASEEVRNELVNPEGLVNTLGQEVTDSLIEWVKTLEDNAKAGRLKAVKIGITKLEQECNLRMTYANTNYTHCKDLLNEREELKGLLSALRAKSKYIQSKGLTLGADLENVYNKTKTSIEKIPTDMVIVRKLMKAFESILDLAK